MKQVLMTFAATVCGLGLAVLGLGAMDIIDLSKLSDVLISSNNSATSVNTKSETVKIGNIETILCSGTFNPEKQLDGTFLCIASKNLSTACMGPDGLSYKNGEKKIFYKTAEKTESNKNQVVACETLEKSCVNGNFAPLGSTDDNDRMEFAHFECKIIDRTNLDEIPCRDDNNLEAPSGSKRVRFLQAEVTADTDCIHIEEYCGSDGQWKTNFPTHTMQKCDFKNSYTPEYMQKNADTLFTPTGELTQQALGNVAIDPTKKTCTTPGGTTIKHGEKFISFRDKVVAFDKECHSKTHTCIDGIIEFIAPYPEENCKINDPRICTIETTKVNILHEGTKTLYKKPTLVDGKSTCEEQQRSCRDGTLDGDSAYIYPSCGNTPVKPSTPTPPTNNRCPNPLGGKPLDHGQSLELCKAGSVGYFDSCDCVQATCQYGTITPAGYAFGSCSKGTPKDCTTPRGKKVAHGSQVEAFSMAGVPFGNTCTSESRLCNDGSLAGSFGFQSCTIGQPVGCSSACGKVDHGSTQISYTNASVEFGNGDTCSANDIQSTCSNGKFSPSVGNFCSCKVAEPKDCIGTQYGDIKHGTSITKHTPTDNSKQGDLLEGEVANACRYRSASCGNGKLFGNLLSHPEATLAGPCGK